MIEAFRAADVLRRVEEIGGEMLDLRAKALVESHLDPSKPELGADVLREATNKASDDAKEQIFERAKEARSGDDATDTTKNRAIPVFRALVDADTRNLDHRYHGELGYLFQNLGDLQESVVEFSNAIQIRDRRGRSGWKSYELKRATAGIRQDRGTGPSKPEVLNAVLADLRHAYADPKHQAPISESREIKEWLSKNSLGIQDLRSEKATERPSEERTPGASS